MNFKMLGSHIEYVQATKRLEEIADASPGSPQAREMKALIRLIIEFEKDIKTLQMHIPGC